MANPIRIDFLASGDKKVTKAISNVSSHAVALLNTLVLLKKQGMDLNIEIDTSDVKGTEKALKGIAKAIRDLSPEQIKAITDGTQASERTVRGLAERLGTLKGTLAAIQNVLQSKGLLGSAQEIESEAAATDKAAKSTKDLTNEKKQEKRSFQEVAESVKELKKQRAELRKEEKGSSSKSVDFAVKAEESRLSLVSQTNRLSSQQSAILKDLVSRVFSLNEGWHNVGNSAQELQNFQMSLAAVMYRATQLADGMTEAQRRSVIPLIASVDLLNTSLEKRREALRVEREITAEAKGYKGVLSASNKLIRNEKEAAKPDVLQNKADAFNAFQGDLKGQASVGVQAQEVFNKSVERTNSLINRNKKAANELFSTLRANGGVVEKAFNFNFDKDTGKVEIETNRLKEVNAELGEIEKRKKAGLPYDQKREKALLSEERLIRTQIDILTNLLNVQRASNYLESVGVSTLEQRRDLLAQIGFLRDKATGKSVLAAGSADSELGKVLANQKSTQVGVVAGAERVAGLSQIDQANEAARQKVQENQRALKNFADGVVKQFVSSIDQIGRTEDAQTRRTLGNMKRTVRSVVTELSKKNIGLEDFRERLTQAIDQAFAGSVGDDKIAQRLREALGRLSAGVSGTVSDAAGTALREASLRQTPQSRREEKVRRTEQDDFAIIDKQSQKLSEILNQEESLIKATAKNNSLLRVRLAAIAREEQARSQVNRLGGVANLTDKQALDIARELVNIEIRNGEVSRRKVINAKEYKARVLEARDALRELQSSAAGSTITDVKPGGKPQAGASNLGLSQVTVAQKEIQNTSKAMEGFGSTSLKTSKHIQNFNEQLAIATLKIIRYRIAFVTMQRAYQTFSDAFSTATSVELGFARIAKVTDVTATTMERLERSAFGLAKNFAQPIADVIDSLQKFAQAGFSIQESFALTEAALLGVNGANLSLEDSTNAALAVMKIYKLEAEDVKDVMDKLTAVQASNAVTATDLAQAIKLVGASAREVGLNLDEFNGIVTAIVSVSRKSGREVGNSLKTMFARFTRPEPVQDLQAVLEDFGLSLFNTEGSLRDLGDILFDISKIWQVLTNTQKINVATTIGGTRRYADFVVLMENYGTALAAANTSLNANGNAVRANALELSTLDAQLRNLKTSLQESLGSFFKSGLLFGGDNSLFNATKGIVEGLNLIQKEANTATSVVKKMVQAFVLLGASAGAKKLGSGLFQGFQRAGATATRSDLASQIVFPKEEQGLFGEEAKLSKRIQLLQGLNKRQLASLKALIGGYKAGKIEAAQFRRELINLGFSAKAAIATEKKLTAEVIANTKASKLARLEAKLEAIERGRLTGVTVAQTAAIRFQIVSLNTWSKATAAAGVAARGLGAAIKGIGPLLAVSVGIELLARTFGKIGSEAAFVNPQLKQLEQTAKKSIVTINDQVKSRERAIKTAEELIERYDFLNQIQQEISITGTVFNEIEREKQKTLNQITELLPSYAAQYKNANVFIEQGVTAANEFTSALDREKQALAEGNRLLRERKIELADNFRLQIENLDKLATRAQKSKSALDGFNERFQEQFEVNQNSGVYGGFGTKNSSFAERFREQGYKDILEDAKAQYQELVTFIASNGIEIDFTDLESLQKTFDLIDKSDAFGTGEQARFEKYIKKIEILGTEYEIVRRKAIGAARETRNAWGNTVDEIESGLKGLIVLTETQKNKIKNSLVDPLLQLEQRIGSTNIALLKFQREFVAIGDSFDYNRSVISKFKKDLEDIINLRNKIERFAEIETRMKRVGDIISSTGLLLDENLDFNASATTAAAYARKIEEIKEEIKQLQNVTRLDPLAINFPEFSDESKKIKALQADLEAYVIRLNNIPAQVSLIDLSSVFPAIAQLPAYKEVLSDLELLAKTKKENRGEDEKTVEVQKRLTNQMEILRLVMHELLDVQEKLARERLEEALRNEESIQNGIRRQKQALDVASIALDLESKIASSTQFTSQKVKDRIALRQEEIKSVGALTGQLKTFISVLTDEEKSKLGFDKPGDVIGGIVDIDSFDTVISTLETSLQSLTGESRIKLEESVGVLRQILDDERKLVELRRQSLQVVQEITEAQRQLEFSAKIATERAKEEFDIRKQILRQLGANQSEIIGESIKQKQEERNLLLAQVGLTEEIVNRYRAQLAQGGISAELAESVSGSEKVIEKVIEIDEEMRSLANQRQLEQTFESLNSQISAARTLMQGLASAIDAAFSGIPQQIIDIRGSISSTNEQIVAEQENILELEHRMNTEIEQGSIEWQRTQREIEKSREKIEDLKNEISFENISLKFLEDLTSGINDAFRRANSTLLQKQLEDALREASFNTFSIETSVDNVLSKHASLSGDGLVGNQRVLYEAHASVIEQQISRLEQIANSLGRPVTNPVDKTGSSRELQSDALEARRGAQTQTELQKAGKTMSLAAATWLVVGDTVVRGIAALLPSQKGASAGGEIGGAFGNILALGGKINPLAAPLFALGGSLIGGFLGDKDETPVPDPDIFQNTSELRENTKAIRDNTLTVRDLRSQLVGAPGNFVLPSFATLGGNLPGAVTSNAGVSNSVSSNVNININGNVSSSDAEIIATRVGEEVSKAYQQQVDRFGFQQRIG